MTSAPTAAADPPAVTAPVNGASKGEHQTDDKKVNSASHSQYPPPSVKWAQRPGGLILITICLADCKDPLIDLTTSRLHFKGKGDADQIMHEVDLHFFGELQAELKDCKYVVRDRCIEFRLVRDDPTSSYWPRLLNDEKKQHWLKVDFDKWMDEDEEMCDGDMDSFGGPGMGGGGNLEEMMRSMGGLGAGGPGGRPDLDDLDLGDEDDDDEEEVDSDDEPSEGGSESDKKSPRKAENGGEEGLPDLE